MSPCFLYLVRSRPVCTLLLSLTIGFSFCPATVPSPSKVISPSLKKANYAFFSVCLMLVGAKQGTFAFRFVQLQRLSTSRLHASSYEKSTSLRVFPLSRRSRSSLYFDGQALTLFVIAVVPLCSHI
ncbi:Uncharacterised protein [Bacillus freudenreichii]|nr:Uncharacterised protein [Bacillus freudenreichii]